MSAILPGDTIAADPVLQRLEGRLANWAAWLNLGEGGKGRCASAEGGYRAPRADEAALVADVQRRAIDVVDAELVERAVTGIPQRGYRAYLFMVYVRQRSDRYVSQRLGVGLAAMDEVHAKVIQAFAVSLSNCEKPVLIRRGANLWAGVARR